MAVSIHWKDQLPIVALNYYFSQQLALHRGRDSLSLALCDVDHFKRFHEHFGHLEGDRCLILVAEAVEIVLPQPDRHGGALWRRGVRPHPSRTGFQGTLRIAESAREAVLALRIPHPVSDTAPFVTISVGVAEASGVTATGHRPST